MKPKQREWESKPIDWRKESDELYEWARQELEPFFQDPHGTHGTMEESLEMFLEDLEKLVESIVIQQHDKVMEEAAEKQDEAFHKGFGEGLYAQHQQTLEMIEGEIKRPLHASCVHSKSKCHDDKLIETHNQALDDLKARLEKK